MIVVKLYGGLGNQMFQYALGRKLALKNNTDLFFDLSWFEDPSVKDKPFELRAFNIHANEGKPNLRKLKYIKEKHFQFDSKILKLKDNVYLDGYWQSYKYWYDIKDIIQQDFTLDKVEPIKIDLTMQTIALHFRRGAYISDNITYHGLLSMNYYEKAIEYISERLKESIKLLIFSDDPDWATKNVEFGYPKEVIDGRKYILPESRSAYSMYIMSLCKHQIIANSSWSWWAAWLNRNPNKIVVTPKQWVAPNSINTKDMIPKEWVRFSVQL